MLCPCACSVTGIIPEQFSFDEGNDNWEFDKPEESLTMNMTIASWKSSGTIVTGMRTGKIGDTTKRIFGKIVTRVWMIILTGFNYFIG